MAVAIDTLVPRAGAPGVEAAAALGYARGYVEDASMPAEADVDTPYTWSFTIHNRGDTGIFGGAITNKGGPAPVKLVWQGTEYEIPVDKSLIIHYREAKPNCTRLETSGEITFPSAGDYKIRVEGVHLEGESWISDHYREFTVTATVPQEWVWWWPWALGGGIVAVVVVGGVVVAEERRKEEMFLMLARR